MGVKWAVFALISIFKFQIIQRKINFTVIGDKSSVSISVNVLRLLSLTAHLGITWMHSAMHHLSCAKAWRHSWLYMGKVKRTWGCWPATTMNQEEGKTVGFLFIKYYYSFCLIGEPLYVCVLLLCIPLLTVCQWFQRSSMLQFFMYILYLNQEPFLVRYACSKMYRS